MFFGSYAMCLRARRHVGLLRTCSAPTPACRSRSTGTATRPGRAERAEQRRPRPAGAVPRHDARLGPAPFPTAQQYPLSRDPHRLGQHLQPGPADAVRADVGRRHPPQADARHRRSRSATSARATCRAGRRSTSTRPTSPTTASSTSSARRRPTCRRTSRAGRGNTFAYTGAGPARRRCRSTSAYFTGTPTGAGGRHGAVHRRLVDRHELHQPAGASTTRTRSRRRAPTPTPASTATRRGAPTRPRRGCRANLFRLNPDVAAANIESNSRLHPLRRAADGADQAPVARLPRAGQLRRSATPTPRRATR